MTLVEAFATGLPVVAGNIGACAEVIRDRETGRLYRPGDAAHLADVLNELFLDEPLLWELGRRARAGVPNEIHTATKLRAAAECVCDGNGACALRRSIVTGTP